MIPLLGLSVRLCPGPHWSVCGYQGWDEFCPAGKFQWKMPENSGMANTPKITEVANTGIYE